MSYRDTHSLFLRCFSIPAKHLTEISPPPTNVVLPAPLSFLDFRSYNTLHLAALSMSTEGTRRAPMMTLGELVSVYLSLAGAFGKRVALSAFPLTTAETEQLFSSYDEDYHISRYFHFSEDQGQKFSINGIAVTHVSLDAEIESLL